MLLENRLDKEVERIAFSFNLPLNLLLYSKYRLKYNRIYPNGIKYDIYAFFCTLFLGVLCFYRIFTLDMTNASMSYMERAILTVVPILFFTIYFIGFVIVFVSDIVYKDNNVLLILTIQTINRSISFSKTNHSFNMWTHISFATVILVNLITRGTFYLTCRYSHISEEISDIVRDFSFVTTDVNMVIATRIIILLKQYMDLWIKAILTTNVAQETDLYCQNLFGVYMNILKAYKIYRKVFQALVLYYAFGDFYITLSTIEVMLYQIRVFSFKDKIRILHNVLSLVWLTKNIILVVIHSIHCEKFYFSVEDAEMACIGLMMKKGCSKSQKHLYKYVIHSNRTFSKMNACGLFNIDAVLPISFMAAITHYVIVLLQVNFL